MQLLSDETTAAIRTHQYVPHPKAVTVRCSIICISALFDLRVDKSPFSEFTICKMGKQIQAMSSQIFRNYARCSIPYD